MSTLSPDELRRSALDVTPSPRSGFIAPLRSVEWRESGAGAGEFTFTGIAVLFNTWSEELWTRYGSFRERILPGAFDDVLARGADVRLLVNHDDNLVLARTKSGTLELSADGEALRVWARVAPTSYANDLRMVMARGDVDQMSFQFDFDPDAGAEDRWYQDAKTGETRRDLIRVSDLYDVSPVTFPAYVDTQAAMRELRKAVSAGIVVPRKASARQRYRRLTQVIAETPWAILPQSLRMILEIVQQRAEGERPSDEEVREAFRSSDREDRPASAGPVAVIPVYGPIFPRANLMTEMSGATAVQDVQGAFRAALADEAVAAILFDIDSPGGVVDLVPELAEEIREARGEKPISAVANATAASAAYWIGSSVDELSVTPSGEVGSIGVWMAHEDWSRFDEKKGVKTTLISAGKYKTEANPFEPLSEEARESLQASVDGYYEMFLAAVAKGRGVKASEVRSKFGEGRMVGAKDALERGMVDHVETFEQAVARLARTPAKRSRPRKSLLSLPDEAFATREALRSALGMTAAPAETDPAGTASSRGTLAEGDSATVAPAETDPVVGDDDALTGLKARTRAEAEQARLEALKAIGAAAGSSSRPRRET